MDRTSLGWTLALAATLASTSSVASEPNLEPTLAPIEARLLYYESARLSDDLLAREEPFFGWNTPIAGGMADEAADDLFVFAVVSGNGQQFHDTPVIIEARDGKGKLLGMRKFGSVLTGHSGKARLPLFLRDSTCAGLIRITAKMGKQERRAEIAMHCGE